MDLEANLQWNMWSGVLMRPHTHSGGPVGFEYYAKWAECQYCEERMGSRVKVKNRSKARLRTPTASRAPGFLQK